MTKVIERRAKKTPALRGLSPGEHSVNMSNVLVRGAQRFSLTEKRVLALAVGKSDSVPAQNLVFANHSGWEIELLASEYQEAYEVSPDSAYEQLQDAAISMLGRTWKTERPGKRGMIYREGVWFTSIEYCPGEGRVLVRFSPEVAPYLLGLRREFTKYKLKQAAALRSVYSWRLFECCKSWEGRKCWNVSIEDFHEAMSTPPSFRQDFGRVESRVIAPAIQELREKNGMLIQCTRIKAGRKVIALRFDFEIDPQGKLDL